MSTREGRTACPGGEGGGPSVRALRVDRKTGEETLSVLAPDDCASAPGPFWVVGSPKGTVVAWAEQRAHADPGAAPIEHLTFRVLATPASEGGVEGGSSESPTPGRLDVQADALADAACDDTGCYAAALLRPDGAGNDASQPGPILGLRYP